MPLLEIQDLSKSFGGVHAVQGCSFSVEEHAVTALIGPNGAGKTTLFNLVNGFLSPDKGRIMFGKEDVTRLGVDKRSRRGMSRTFQSSRVFRNLTLHENLLLALRDDDDDPWRMFFSSGGEDAYADRVREAMRFVGLEKPLDAPVTELSYGEQKLFDLTRAILNPHTLLLLDEPVAGVNPVIRSRLKEILPGLKKQGETVLLIEHDMDFVRGVADRLIVLDQGKVLAEGAPAEVLRDPRVLDAYLGPEAL